MGASRCAPTSWSLGSWFILTSEFFSFLSGIQKLLPLQFPILHPHGLVRRRPEPFVPRLFVIGEITLVPDHRAVALKRENVGGDTVQKPAVMAYHHHAAGKIEDRLFERLQGLDVEIVGRFVEEQHVAAALQEFGKVHAVALAARNLAHQALLVGTGKVELAHIRAGIHGGFAEHDRIGRRR
jgi:hypothetical protein